MKNKNKFSRFYFFQWSFVRRMSLFTNQILHQILVQLTKVFWNCLEWWKLFEKTSGFATYLQPWCWLLRQLLRASWLLCKCKFLNQWLWRHSGSRSHDQSPKLSSVWNLICQKQHSKTFLRLSFCWCQLK